MKKRALIITPVAFSLLVGLGACANNGETPDTITDKVTKSLKIDTASVKKDYFVGEEFTSYGLKVYLVETSGETSKEKQLDRNDYYISIEDGTKFEEKSEKTTVTVTYAEDSSLTASYDITVTKVFTLEEVFTNYQNSKNYIFDITTENLDDGTKINEKIVFTENAVYYDSINGGLAKDLEDNIFSFYIKDDGSIRPGKGQDFDSLYVGEGINPGVWSLKDFDYAPVALEAPNEDGYYEINQSNNIAVVWQMMGYYLVSYMQYKADVKVNDDGTLTFVAEMKPQAAYADLYASMKSTINVSPIGEATIPEIDEYISAGKSSYDDFAKNTELADRLVELSSKRNYTITVKSNNLNVGYENVDRVMKFTENGYYEDNLSSDTSLDFGYFNYKNSNDPNKVLDEVYYYQISDSGITVKNKYPGLENFWNLFSGVSKTNSSTLVSTKLEDGRFEVLDSENVNALSIAINPYLFSGVYTDDLFDELLVKLNDDGGISYDVSYGDNGSVSVTIDDIGTTVIDGLDGFINSFKGL